MSADNFHAPTDRTVLVLVGPPAYAATRPPESAQPKCILGAMVERQRANSARGRIESRRKRGLPLWGHAVDDADELAATAE